MINGPELHREPEDFAVAACLAGLFAKVKEDFLHCIHASQKLWQTKPAKYTHLLDQDTTRNVGSLTQTRPKKEFGEGCFSPHLNLAREMCARKPLAVEGIYMSYRIGVSVVGIQPSTSPV
jgi:hypothetical protein